MSQPAPFYSAIHFPSGFLWGAATSAHQVEGGNRANDWWWFEQTPGKIAHGDRSGDACRHYELFDSDFALAEADGHNAHRLSFEWSRIEPERGRIDAGAVAHYHAVLESLRRRHLLPIVTLHHFTNPVWIAQHGGWENRETIDHFARFVSFCAREFGGEVDWWCTVNEPEVLAFHGWSEGKWPPGKHDDSLALEVMANLLEAHGRAYRILHDEDRIDADGDGRAVMASFAKNRPVLEPERPLSPFDRARAHLENQLFNDAVEDAAATGEILLRIPGARPIKRRVPELERSLDWFGLNYYTRYQVRMFAADVHVAKRGAPVTELGWEIYPQGLEDSLVRVGRLGVPVLVTENGFADRYDKQRPKALVEHLAHLARAIDRGVKVLGYLHWSLLDNFEWADGYAPRFGLYAVDFDDPERRRLRRPSAEVFARIARANALVPELAAEVGASL